MSILYIAIGILIIGLLIYKLAITMELNFDGIDLIKIIVYSIILIIIYLYIYNISDGDIINSLFIVIAIILCVSIRNKKNRGLVIFLISITVINIINCQNIIFSSYEIVNQRTLMNIDGNSLEIKVIILCSAIMIVLIELFNTIIVKKKLLNNKDFDRGTIKKMNLVMTILLLINYGFFHYLFYFDNNNGFLIFDLFCSCVSAVLNIYIIIFVVYRYNTNELIETNTILNKQIQIQYRHYLELEKHYDEIIRIKHDMKNHNNLIASFIKNKEYNKLDEYMSKINDQMYNVEENLFISKNKVIDAICLNKSKLCKRNKIKITFDIRLPEKLSIDDIDICSIYGNLLDNAIEACENIKDENIQKKIWMESKIANGYLIIKIINSKEGKSIKEKDRFLTTKSNKKFHGLGLSSVRKSIKKYSGEMMINDLENKFIVSIVIKY